MTVSDNTIQTEVRVTFFISSGTSSAKAGENLATIVLKNSGRVLEITLKIATASATKKPKKMLSTLPEVINFYHTCRRL